MPGLRGPIELVLFDLGGTLFHELGPWGELYRRADAELWKVLRREGVSMAPHDLYGDAETLFELYARNQSPDLNERPMAAFLGELLRASGMGLNEGTLRAALRGMYAVTQPNWGVEDDAISMLQRLKADGFRIGAVSNGADEDNTQSLVDKSGVRPFLETVVSSAAFGRRKPDPGIFRAALRHFGTRPERAVMVGDNYEADILGAHGVGVQAIWFTRHVGRPLPETAQGEPEAVVEALSQIPALLPAI